MISDKIMIVDDDPSICRALQTYVYREGYDIIAFRKGAEALEHMTARNPSLILLDATLPEMDGFEVLERIREFSEIPVIMLTARDWLDDKILAFELGANDCIVKPFEPLEVIARIKARLRKRSMYRGELMKLNDFSLDMARNQVKIRNNVLNLKHKEIQLLQFMLDQLNIVITREELLKRIWNTDSSSGTRTVDMHIKRLRDTLMSAGAEVSINTVWGAGYKLVVKQ